VFKCVEAKLRWKEHIKEKRDEFNIKFRKMYWSLGRNSKLSVQYILTLYKQVIHPVLSYGIQLWGCVSGSNIQVIQHYQNKVLKCIVNAPWCIQNSDQVTDIIAKFAKSHEKRLQDHINMEASRLLSMNNITRRLK
jgi:Leu/Phe-tRNA-protein transferase